ncbi:MAG: hypothetical protein RLZZ337_270 [Bacteroidota bacterium]|jgi:hypothetical protein
MRTIYLSIITFLAASCTSQKIVRPLQEGEQQVSANLGGPLIGFAGAVIPVPLTSINCAKGISDSLTLHGGIQTTSLLYKTLQLDAGATYGFIKPDGWKPGLSASGSLNFLTDFREGNPKIYPQIDVNAYWDYASNNFMYLGITNWIEFQQTMTDGQEQRKQLLSGIQFGNTFSTEKWNYTIESKWLAPTRNSTNLVVDYRSYKLGGESRGAVGIYVGFARKF